MYRKFNVATFVNLFVVGMAALTIALFVFTGRNSETREKADVVAGSVEAVDEKDAPTEVAAASVVEEAESAATLETENVVLTSESEVSEVAEASDVESAPVADAVESEDSELDELFAADAVSDVVLEPESDVAAVAEASEVESAPVAPNAEETAELDALLAEENSNAEIAEAAPLALETSDVVAEEAGDLDALFADEVAPSVENASNVSAAEEETNEFDALFAEVETTPVADEVAPFIEEDAAELDALFADDVLTEENTEVAADEPEAVVEDAVAAEPEAVVEDAVVVESEAVVDEVVVADEAEAVAVEPEAVADDAVAVEPETVVEDVLVAEPEAVVKTGDAVETNNESVWVAADAVADVEETTVEQVAAAPVLENEFWVVGQEGNGFYLYRMEAGAWVAKSVDDFAAASAEFTTIVYAHGYQTDMVDATQDAAAFKATLDAARQSVGAERPFRLVVWKWNSEREMARIRIDAQEKAFLADYSGKALGRFLGGLDWNGDLALVGFSFGARVVGSALQTLATFNVENAVVDLTFDENDDFAFAVSGTAFADSVAAVELAAQSVADANEANVAERKIALILVAAACDLGAFEPRGVYGRGATLPTKVLNVYNPNDFALKYYRHVSETRSDAQGVAPLRTGVFPNAAGNTFNVNSNPTLGKRHNFVDAIRTVPRQTIGVLAL